MVYGSWLMMVERKYFTTKTFVATQR